jgi:hypothetical protein
MVRRLTGIGLVVLTGAVSGAPRAAAPSPAGPEEGVTTEEVRFRNGDVTLAGLLYVPRADGPVPGLMLIQGSGDSGRSNRWSVDFAEAFSRRGYAVLLPDERGVGASQGDWRTAGFEALARDALSGAKLMRRDPRIDAARVGYMGLSQGGHVAPLAGRLDRRAAFVIDVSGSLVTMEEQLYDELDLAYREHGLDDATIAYLQELARFSFDYIKRGENWDRYIERHREIARGPLKKAVATWPTSREDGYWTFWRNIWAHDPMPHWRTLTERRDVPCLVVLGADDGNVNVAHSRERARGLAGDEDFVLRIYPDTGHALWQAGTQELRGDVIRETDEWLRQRMASSPSRNRPS